MHVSGRDSPQSLEFWEDGRLPGNYAVVNIPAINTLSVIAGRVASGWQKPHCIKRQIALGDSSVGSGSTCLEGRGAETCIMPKS
jgi:hypothetical protein